MVAAATTSLPERAEEGRNYDYRYVWIRDQCYAGEAVAQAGPYPLLDDAVRFVTATGWSSTAPNCGPPTRPRRAASPTNAASTCPATRAAATWSATGSTTSSSSTPSARRYCCSPPPPTTTTSTPTAGAPPSSPPRRSSGAGGARRRHLGARTRRWTHSRLICAAGTARDRRLQRPPREQAARWLALADAIVADTAARCAAPLRALAALARRRAGRRRAAAARDPRGAVPADDPRPSRPCDAVQRELTEDGYVLPLPPRRASARRGRGRLPPLRLPDGARARPAGRPCRARHAGSSATAQPAGRRGCSPRSSTSPSASCAATCRRRSSTRCCSNAPSSRRVLRPRPRRQRSGGAAGALICCCGGRSRQGRPPTRRARAGPATAGGAAVSRERRARSVETTLHSSRVAPMIET